MKRKLAKAHPINPKGRKKKQKKGPEIVDSCDYCGGPLNRTCARTDASGICALGSGIVSAAKEGERWTFYCNEVCRGIDGK